MSYSVLLTLRGKHKQNSPVWVPALLLFGGDYGLQVLLPPLLASIIAVRLGGSACNLLSLVNGGFLNGIGSIHGCVVRDVCGLLFEQGGMGDGTIRRSFFSEGASICCLSPRSLPQQQPQSTAGWKSPSHVKGGFSMH